METGAFSLRYTQIGISQWGRPPTSENISRLTPSVPASPKCFQARNTKHLIPIRLRGLVILHSSQWSPFIRNPMSTPAAFGLDTRPPQRSSVTRPPLRYGLIMTAYISRLVPRRKHEYSSINSHSSHCLIPIFREYQPPFLGLC